MEKLKVEISKNKNKKLLNFKAWAGIKPFSSLPALSL
jgi:hypothetical protein